MIKYAWLSSSVAGGQNLLQTYFYVLSRRWARTTNDLVL